MFSYLVALQEYNNRNEEAIIWQRSAISSKDAVCPTHHTAPGYNSCHKRGARRLSVVVGALFAPHSLLFRKVPSTPAAIPAAIP